MVEEKEKQVMTDFKGFAIFTPGEPAKSMEWGKSSVSVQRGTAGADSVPAIAVGLKHGPSGNETAFLLSENGASALHILLGECLPAKKS